MKKILVFALLGTLVMPITSFAGAKNSKAPTSPSTNSLRDKIHVGHMYQSELEEYVQTPDTEKAAYMDAFEAKLKAQKHYGRCMRNIYSNRGKVGIASTITALLTTVAVVVYLKRAAIKQQIAKIKHKA